MHMTRIHLEKLNRNYGENAAVKDVSFTVEDGSSCVILGPSGAGKTTLLRCIAGLEKPDGGSVYFDEKDVSALTPAERRISMIFQTPALFDHTRVKDNIAYGMAKLGFDQKEILRRTEESARMLHIEKLLERYPLSLSGGEKQRVSIARAMIREPSILLLDEPFSSLDTRLAQELCEEVRRLQKEKGMTMITVTHDQTEAMALADQLILMKDGRIAAMRTPLSLYNDPPNLFAADFLGETSVNKVSRGTKLFEQLEDKYPVPPSAETIAFRPSAACISSEGKFSGILISLKEGYEADQALVKAGDTDVLIALEKGMRLSEEFRFDLNPASLLIFDENGDSLNHAGNVV